MVSEPIRLGYVGCGFMAQKVHLPNFSALPGCELVALAELRRELGKQVQAHWQIPKLYADHEAMLADPDIDAVAVSAAFAIQGDITRDALLAGKHVFMEKPMAISLSQADALLAAADRSGKQLMIGYMKRYDAGNQLGRQEIQRARRDHDLGHLTYVRNHGFCGDWVAGLDAPMYTSDEPMPTATLVGPDWLPEEHLGHYISYLQQYTHNINLMRWLLDAGDDVRIKAVDLDGDGYTGVVIFEMAGVRCILESGRVSHYRWDEHTQVYFQDGWVKLTAPPLLLRQVPAEVEIYHAGERQQFIYPVAQPAWSWSYQREAAHFVECLQAGLSFDSSGEDTRTDVRLFEEIYRIHLQQSGKA